MSASWTIYSPDILDINYDISGWVFTQFHPNNMSPMREEIPFKTILIYLKSYFLNQIVIEGKEVLEVIDALDAPRSKHQDQAFLVDHRVLNCGEDLRLDHLLL